MTRTALFLTAAIVLAACGKSEPASEASAPAVATPPPASAPAAPPPAATTPAVADFDAVGTEPFWAVKVRADSLTLNRPDYAEVKVAAQKPEVSGETVVWRAEGMSISITPGECSDGMSDRKYAYIAEVRVSDQVLKGCAFKAGEAPSVPPA